jgi:amino acid permease
MLIVFSVMTQHTAKLLVKCMDLDVRKPAYSYGDIGEMAFGPPGRTFISVLFFLELFAACVALVILAADSIVALIPSFDLNIVKIVVTALIVPMTISRSLSFAAYGSLLGVIAIVNLMFIIFFDGLSTTETVF